MLSPATVFFPFGRKCIQNSWVNIHIDRNEDTGTFIAAPSETPQPFCTVVRGGGGGGGGAVAQSVERATPDEEIPGSIAAVATRSPTGWVGVSVM